MWLRRLCRSFLAFFARDGHAEVAPIRRTPADSETRIVRSGDVDRGLIRAFSDARERYEREGLPIDPAYQNEDDFNRNLVCLRAEERLALCVYRPVSFIKVTGLT